jgi:hypothetical protein
VGGERFSLSVRERIGAEVNIVLEIVNFLILNYSISGLHMKDTSGLLTKLKLNNSTAIKQASENNYSIFRSEEPLFRGVVKIKTDT